MSDLQSKATEMILFLMLKHKQIQYETRQECKQRTFGVGLRNQHWCMRIDLTLFDSTLMKMVTSTLAAGLVSGVGSQLKGSGYCSAKVTSGNYLTSTHSRDASTWLLLLYEQKVKSS